MKIFNIKAITYFMEETTFSIMSALPEKMEVLGEIIKKILPIKKLTHNMEELTDTLLTIIIDNIRGKVLEWEYTPIEWDFFSKKSLVYTSSLSIALALLTISMGILAHNQINSAISISYDEEVVAIVRDADYFLEIVEDKEEELSDFYGYEKSLNKPFIFTPIVATEKELTKRDDIRKFVAKNTEGMGFGYELFIGNECLGMVKNEEMIKKIESEYINLIIPMALRENSEIKEKIECRRAFSKDATFDNPLEIVQSLYENLQTVKYYEVGEGESLPFVAKLEDIDYTLFRELNPEVDNFPKAGTKLKISKGPVLNISSWEERVVEEDLDYEVEYETDKNLYDVRSYVKQEGQNGRVRAKDRLYYENNKLVSIERLDSLTLKEPVKKVIVKGGKATPKYIASGKFSYPARGRFTSGFGRRWGRMHKGIDLAGAYGSPIKASDGGTVIFVGNYYGLGKMIKIDHGNGYETVYGHLSRYNVKKGDKVGKGETIGYMGSTGRSTGTHLHFEVHKNGVAVNPLNYLNR